MSNAVTRKEAYLKSIGDGTSSALKPITREEQYLAYIAGDTNSFPTNPITREEAFLDKIAKNGAGGGGSSINVQPLTVTANGTFDAPDGQAYDPVIVNVAGGGGIIDVETLPTKNIDENAIYRVTEEVNISPEVYIAMDGAAYTVAEFFAMQGANATVPITVVAELPEVMEPLDQATLTIPLYVLESDGKAYLSIDGTSASAMPFGAMTQMTDYGWTDDITTVTESGVYCVRGENYFIYHYWKYGNSVWSEFISTIEVSELPTEDIQRNTCYILLDTVDGIEVKRYFVYDNEWVEYLVPDGELTISSNGTYDVSRYANLTVDFVDPFYVPPLAPLDSNNKEVILEVNIGKQEQKDITLNLWTSTGSGSLPIDWGDGTSERIKSETPITHTYAEAGKYIITILANAGSTGSVDVGMRNIDWLTSNLSNPLTRFTSTILNMTSATDRAWNGMTNLTHVSIYKIESIGKSAFENCTSLRYFEIREGTGNVGSSAFKNCSALEKIIINPTSRYFPDASAFRGCSALQEFILPYSLTTIVRELFYDCVSLNNIIIPEGVDEIGASAFTNCKNFDKLIFPKALTTIGETAFDGCTAMKTYDFSQLEAVPTLGANAFNGIPSDCEILVPSVLYNEWIAATNWAEWARYIKAV